MRNELEFIVLFAYQNFSGKVGLLIELLLMFGNQMDDLIDPLEVIISTGRRMSGGQYVGVTTSVHVHHVPTGIKVFVDVGRSQLRNRQIAMDALAGALTSPSYQPGE